MNFVHSRREKNEMKKKRQNYYCEMERSNIFNTLKQSAIAATTSPKHDNNANVQ